MWFYLRMDWDHRWAMELEAMTIPPDTLVTEIRHKLAQFIQEEIALDGHICIGSMLVFETIGENGRRGMFKFTTSADGVSALPVWTQTGFLDEAGDHSQWGEWEVEHGVDYEE